MIALTTSLAFILVAGPQETCMASDTACRVRELERRVEALERRLGGPVGGGPDDGLHPLL